MLGIAQNFDEDGHGHFRVLSDVPERLRDLQAEVVVVQLEGRSERRQRGGGRRADLVQSVNSRIAHSWADIAQRFGQRSGCRGGLGADQPEVHRRCSAGRGYLASVQDPSQVRHARFANRENDSLRRAWIKIEFVRHPAIQGEQGREGSRS